MKPNGPCEIASIGGCLGRVEVHHLDHDPWNNELPNLMRLCGTHHSLVESGRIDLADPVMPAFIIRGGKRRYLHAGHTGLSRSEARSRVWAEKRAARAREAAL